MPREETAREEIREWHLQRNAVNMFCGVTPLFQPRVTPLRMLRIAASSARLVGAEIVTKNGINQNQRVVVIFIQHFLSAIDDKMARSHDAYMRVVDT